ncbi:hypothetical protein [Desulfobacter postgatei]|uniref:hypothetical protein n=1 Tax=Desulfobacter postgatei TaxID=2293 RepID=UPI002A362BFB|nr:hypothetical protein [Desulfobacter postgatei]MDX9965053.1 hypothetical protein [Desulfobacter postgatei]
MSEQSRARANAGKSRRRQNRSKICHCCGAHAMFCWQCRCGFSMCQSCMYENQWGMTCNGITWQCPDCGAQNGYGNQ